VLFSDSDDDLDQETDEVTNSATAPDEIDAYSTTNFDFEDGNDAPLAVWKSHGSRFPKLAVIARSVYLIPASQNESERAFSAAGHVMTDLKATLNPEHLDELLLLRSFNKVKGSIGRIEFTLSSIRLYGFRHHDQRRENEDTKPKNKCFSLHQCHNLIKS